MDLRDVYASCLSLGSMDAETFAVEPNDLAKLLMQCHKLRFLTHTGCASTQYGRHTAQVPTLPSTNSAKAALPPDRLQAAWAVGLALAGANGVD